MTRQSQWLFETPSDQTFRYHANPEYETPLEQEWEISAGNYYNVPLTEDEWEALPSKRRVGQTGQISKRTNRLVTPSQGRRVQSTRPQAELSRLQSERFRNDQRLQSAANNRPPMRIGERGEAVKKLQQALIDLGFPMPISTRRTGLPDGIYGKETANTVRQFQIRHQLQADGVAGKQTLNKLDQLFTHQRTQAKLVWDKLMGYVWLLPNTMTAEANLYEADFDIVGPDDSRIVVRDTSQLPFRWICRLDLELAKGPTPVRALGTGILISPRHVLTAGHNLVNRDKGTVLSISVAPAFNPCSRQPAVMGEIKEKTWRPCPLWATRDGKPPLFDTRFDFGLITLERSVKEFWGSEKTSTIAPLPLRVGDALQLAGYPGDTCLDRRPDRRSKISPCKSTPPPPCNHPDQQMHKTAQWISSGNVTRIGQRILQYNNDACGGQSGSPVWVTNGNIHTLVAIHTRGNNELNEGILLTDSVRNQLREWMRLDGVTPSF